MKIKELKEKLEKELKNPTKIRFTKKQNVEKKDPIIIGITGSRGKSSVAYMLHYYLKSLGYQSILYSSIEIDSELSFTKKHFAVDNPLKSKKNLLCALEQSIEQNVDFLILEVNEKAISLGIIDDIDFDIRVLTNIIEKQNEYFYPNYVDIKKSFLLNAKKNEKLVYIIRDSFCSDLLKELDNNNQFIISTPYLIERYNLNKDKIKCILNSNKPLDSINGIEFNLLCDDEINIFSSKMMFPYSFFNIACVYGVLKMLNLYDHKKFSNFMTDLTIPGRDEKIVYKNKNIIISVNLVPQLEELAKYKSKNQINNIIVVTGATGLGFKGWKKEFSDELINLDKYMSMKFAYNYINKYADKVVITSTDVGSSNIDSLLDIQFNLLDDSIDKVICNNRETAIKNAIINATENDVIFISGRGNRSILCNSENNITFSKDIDIVNKILKILNKE